MHAMYYRSLLASMFIVPWIGITSAQDGALDPTFDGDGWVSTDVFGARYDDANAMILQPDGKIVVAGTSGFSEEQDFALVRYMPDGSIDGQFGTNGHVLTSIAPGNDIINALALQEDGMIIAGGYSYLPEGIGQVLARFTVDGELDTTFGTGGIVIPDFGDGITVTGGGVAVQDDGRILLSGGGNGGSALARFNVDGTPDMTFGDAGLALCAFDGTSSQANAIALQPDGMIVLAGYASGGSVDSIAIARFTSGGFLDPTFGIDGRMRAALPNGTIARAVAIRPDGKIMVAGAATTHAAVARFTSDGWLDGTFFGGGMRILNMVNVTLSSAYGLAVLADGRTLICGGAFLSSNDFLLVRLDDNGNYDASFDADGIVLTDLVAEPDIAHAMTLQPDGGIVLAGVTFGGFQDNNFAVARYQSSDVTGITEPKTFHGVSVHPDPITSASVLEYVLTQGDIVSIDLFDARGAFVRSLVDRQVRSAGAHREALGSGTALSPGVYGVRLRVGGHSITTCIAVM